MRTVLFIVLLVVVPPALAFTATRWLVAGAEALPSLGPVDGMLQPCPPGMGCVSSREPDDRRIDPLPFEGDPDIALRRMQDFLRDESGAVYVRAAGNDLHATFVRPNVDLVEDVELLLSREAGVFHLRVLSRSSGPASSSGERAEQLRRRWAAATQRDGKDGEGREEA